VQLDASPQHVHVVDEPLIYREAVLTIMVVLGDMRTELQRLRRVFDEDDEEEEEDT
jgi:hypothetical protein